MKKLFLTKQVIQQKEPTEVDVAKDNLKDRTCNFRRSLLIAIGEVSTAITSREQVEVQQKSVRSSITRPQTGQTNPITSFKDILTTYLEMCTSKKDGLESEPGLAVMAKQLLAATSELYRSFGSGWNETIK